MTSKVTVDAHAGWPILVTYIRGEPTRERTVITEVVEPSTIKDFYIHSGLRILNIEEQVRG